MEFLGELAGNMLTCAGSKLLKGDLSILQNGKTKRKSGETEKNVEDSAPTNASKQAKINPNFLTATLSFKAVIVEHDVDLNTITLRRFDTNNEEMVNETKETIGITNNTDTDFDFEPFDIVAVEGSHQRTGGTTGDVLNKHNFTVTSIKHKVVEFSKEKVTKIIENDTEEDGLVTAVEFINMDDTDDISKSMSFLLTNENDTSVRLGSEHVATKVQVHMRRVPELESEYMYRILSISKGVDEISSGILIECVPYNYLQNFFLHRLLPVSFRNKTDETVKLVSCELVNVNANDAENLMSKILVIDPKKFNFSLVKQKTHKPNLKVQPAYAGEFKGQLMFNFVTTTLNQEFIKMVDIEFKVGDQDNSQWHNAPRRGGSRVFVDQKIPGFTLQTFDEAKIREITAMRNDEKFEAMKVELGCVDSPLKPTADNYKDVLHVEEFLESLERERRFAEAMENQCQKQQLYFERTDRMNIVKLMMDNIGEMRPAVAIGDRMIAMNPLTTEIFDGHVVFIELDYIELKFNERFTTEDENGHRILYEIKIMFNKLNINSFHHAINIVGDKIGVASLFPSEDSDEIKRVKRAPVIDAKLDTIAMNLIIGTNKRQWVDTELDQYQKEAVVKALRGEYRSMPFVIHGPPGTGKTKTLIEIACQLRKLKPSSRIIIATPSNSAANLFTEKLMQIPFLQDEFVRLVSFNQSERALIPENILEYCATIDVSNDNMHEELEVYHVDDPMHKMNRLQIQKYKIVITTSCNSAQLMKMKFDANHFDTVIFDEAGQSTEPETYIPLTQLSRDGLVILAGDHLQLGPCSFSPFTKKFGWRRSLLERLVGLPCYQNPEFPELISVLKKNYRSVPSILELYNRNFYGNMLEGTVNGINSPEIKLLDLLKTHLWETGNDNRCGLYFVDVVKGKNTKMRGKVKTHSWKNDEELKQIGTILATLRNMEGLTADDIGIITPYVLQRDLIRRDTLANMKGFETVKVGTVEEFQGQERKIILVSLVRTDPKQYEKDDADKNLGFINCNKRMNVSISRAKSLLIIFGKASALANHEKWKSVVDHAKANSTFIEP